MVDIWYSIASLYLVSGWRELEPGFVRFKFSKRFWPIRQSVRYDESAKGFLCLHYALVTNFPFEISEFDAEMAQFRPHNSFPALFFFCYKNCKNWCPDTWSLGTLSQASLSRVLDHMDSLSQGDFVTWHFYHKGISSHGNFITRIDNHMDSLSHHINSKCKFVSYKTIST